MADKIFCGNGKEKFNGDLIAVSFCLDDYPKEYMFKSEKTGKRYLKLDVSRRKGGEDQYGNSHSVSVNTWQPDKAPAPKAEQPSFESDIPF